MKQMILSTHPLVHVVTFCKLWSMYNSNHLHIYFLYLGDTAVQEMVQLIISCGGEGGVLRYPASEYHLGRAHSSLKVKV